LVKRRKVKERDHSRDLREIPFAGEERKTKEKKCRLSHPKNAGKKKKKNAYFFIGGLLRNQ